MYDNIVSLLFAGSFTEIPLILICDVVTTDYLGDVRVELSLDLNGFRPLLDRNHPVDDPYLPEENIVADTWMRDSKYIRSFKRVVEIL